MHPRWIPRRGGARVAPRPEAGSLAPATLDEAVLAVLHWVATTTVYRQRIFAGERTVDIYPLRDPPAPAQLVAAGRRYGTASIEAAAAAVAAFAGMRERAAVRAFCTGMVVDTYPSKPSRLVQLEGAAFPADDWIYRYDLEVVDLGRRGVEGLPD